jgi:hypothetical protein
VQTFHLKVLERYAPKKSQKFWLLVGFYILWLFVFSIMLWRSAFAGDVAGYGKPHVLSCTSKLWYVVVGWKTSTILMHLTGAEETIAD